MKTFYHIDNFTGTITELKPDDIIDLICLMRTHGAKDGRFYKMAESALINIFWMWQSNFPEEVDPAFQIFDRIEDAQAKQQENRLTDKLNEEIKEYLETEK